MPKTLKFDYYQRLGNNDDKVHRSKASTFQVCLPLIDRNHRSTIITTESNIYTAFHCLWFYSNYTRVFGLFKPKRLLCNQITLWHYMLTPVLVFRGLDFSLSDQISYYMLSACCGQTTTIIINEANKLTRFREIIIIRSSTFFFCKKFAVVLY